MATAFPRTDDRNTLSGLARRAEYFRSLLAEMRSHRAFVACECGRAECITYRIDAALAEKSA